MSPDGQVSFKQMLLVMLFQMPFSMSCGDTFNNSAWIGMCLQTIVTGAGDETLRFWNVFPSVKTPVSVNMSFFHVLQNAKAKKTEINTMAALNMN